MKNQALLQVTNHHGEACGVPPQIDEQTFRQSMSVIVKHRTDLDTVAARVGVKLEAPADARPAA